MDISGASINVKWDIVFGSVRGHLHIRKNLPNQDSILWESETYGPPSGQNIALAVADGHGSPRSFRSKRGSSLAVQVAMDVMYKFLGVKTEPDLKLVKDMIYRKIPREIVDRWNEEIKKDIKTNPFSESEISKIKVNGTPLSMDTLKEKPFEAYGSTLLSVFVSDRFIAYFQIGDGDILEVAKNGTVTRPVSKDSNLLGNETTSLCLNNAWKYFRVRFERLTEENYPLLIMLSTDGYSNSFEDRNGFEQAAIDLLNDIKSNGIKYIEENIIEWLKETSKNGSGDDITLGLLINNKHKNLREESAEGGDTHNGATI